MNDDQSRTISRRTYLRASGAASAAAVAGLAGCMGGDGDGNGEGELEIAHWWTAGGEEDAIEALIEGFEEEYPDYEVDNNPTPGGAGSALEADVRNRVIDGNPPSTFQIWPGEALTLYTEEDLLEDVGDIWDDEMQEAYLDGPRELSQDDEGTFVAVPINIHRLNNLFYNVEVVEDAGIDPEEIEDPEALVEALAAVEDAGSVGMIHQTQEPWSTLQLWENALLGLDPDAYQTTIDGDPESVEDEVMESLELTAEYAAYFNDDASSVAWDEANNRIINGEAAFLHQGDWAAGQYEASEDFEYGEDWDYIPFPGTEGLYQTVMDAFVMPTENPSPEATEAFLAYAGTTDAQARFNVEKGSIPPRTDVDMGEFTEFLQAQMEDFEESEDQPPQIAHGLALPPDQHSDMEGVFANFNESFDADQAYDGIVSVFE
ncbi:ABC transporter substrate-binding protein [Halalkalicoccus tibetensis]|uniref:ABC transporter substrate-binding protein n=1 Tax=Halalkalicoccus tibetensis TaxID=175632 RepID=A0ABD5V5D6_9EURY